MKREKIKKPVSRKRKKVGKKPLNLKSRQSKSKKTAIKRKEETTLTLHKSPENPIIGPIKEREWESWQTFNPAALFENDKVHLLYRAIGKDGVSRLGYASSRNGIHIDERLERPVFTYSHTSRPLGVEFYHLLNYISGGSWAGCEDPRLTLIEDTVYMLFVSFDGWNSVRIGLTSIKLSDLRGKKWNWKKQVFISPPGEIHKNWVIFPEKINGKYAILTSISPKISITYVDDLDEFDGSKYINSPWSQAPRKKDRWDSWIRGAGPPPIKTKYGWLLLYHAMDHHDPNKYKLGAMILSLKNPTKILYRSKEPLLEPDEYYENEGFKAGVVYSCGAVVIDKDLFVFYGGADTVVCVATANLENFLQSLMQTKKPKLKPLKKLSK